MRAAFTGGGFTGGGCFDEGVRRVFLPQLVQHAIIGSDDEGVAVGELRRTVENRGGGADDIGELYDRIG